ncbi:Trk system potassium transporter TrkA [Facklamia sp. DSM 111018]|uniref:Trk system potassium transporter TrkA n=1 Tax=Facklamia lactis TaxID=2749967 RepID=A0ABS0LPN8_9LACT|nr:Trk system potassium transporter TrkA [Facklamia lactis]MBG9986121.1 Trk system potassium transporter TrkA [Facklamia lactis]
MEIVIAGGGAVGEVICQELAQEGHNIVLIEQDADRLDHLINHYDITGIVGDGVNYDHLVTAGTKNCDVFIAVTPEDEFNIIASVFARKLGAKEVIARVRHPKYATNLEFVQDELGISLMINPEFEAARHMAELLRFPASVGVETFSHGRVSIVELEIDRENPLVGMQISDFRDNFGNVLICVIERQDHTFIPDGNDSIMAFDRLYVTGSADDLFNFYPQAGYSNKKIKNAMIIGGGRITQYLLTLLSSRNIQLTVIDRDLKVVEELSRIFPNVVFVHGNGKDHEFLQEQRIEKYDSVICLTGFDEENIIISLYASSLKIKKIITKVNRPYLVKMLDDLWSMAIITPKRLIANHILRFVRSLTSNNVSSVNSLYRIADNEVEALEFEVNNSSKVLNIPFKELQTRDNLIVAVIIRNGKRLFPTGEDCIIAGDHVIIVTKHKRFEDIDDILA